MTNLSSFESNVESSVFACENGSYEMRYLTFEKGYRCTVNHLARRSRKNIAICGNFCELQVTKNREFLNANDSYRCELIATSV